MTLAKKIRGWTCQKLCWDMLQRAYDQGYENGRLSVKMYAQSIEEEKEIADMLEMDPAEYRRSKSLTA